MVFKTKSIGSAGSGGMSFIGAEAQFSGNIATKGDLHIDGSIEGDVTCQSLVLGEQGSVRGNIRADTVKVGGAVIGTIDARSLSIDRTARIEGDLRYETVAIENGARVEGRVSLAAAGAADSNGQLKLVGAGE